MKKKSKSNCNRTSKINVAPMIEAKGKVLAFVGDQVDAKYVIEKSGAKATDKEDGDLTAKIEVEGKVDTSKSWRIESNVESNR